MPVLPGRIMTFLFVLLTWVLFRAADISQAKQLYKAMFLPEKFALSGNADLKTVLLFLAGAFIIFFLKPAVDLEEKFKPTVANALLTIFLLTTSMFFFVKYSPFIYFNF